MIKKHPITLECQKALYADSNRIFITICHRRASRPTAIFYLLHNPTNLIDLQLNRFITKSTNQEKKIFLPTSYLKTKHFG